MAGMTQREKDALDRHLTTEPDWREPWGTVHSDGNPVEAIYITKTIATIVPGDGTLHPVQAAFVAIADEDDDGRYEFTRITHDGADTWTTGRWIVNVERTFTSHDKRDV